MRTPDWYQAPPRLQSPGNQPAMPVRPAATASPGISTHGALRDPTWAPGPASPTASRPAYPHRAYSQRWPPAAQPGGAAPHGWPAFGGNRAKDITLPAYGEPGHPVAEEFETSLDKTKTLFFERKVSIFQVWQLFFIWLAVTGLAVYIASLIGFREETATTTPHYTDIMSTRRDNVNSTCDHFTPCQGAARCVAGQCVCEAPDFMVVDDICIAASG